MRKVRGRPADPNSKHRSGRQISVVLGRAASDNLAAAMAAEGKNITEVVEAAIGSYAKNYRPASAGDEEEA